MITFTAKVTRADARTYVKYAFPIKLTTPWLYLIFVITFSIFSWFFVINEDTVAESITELAILVFSISVVMLFLEGIMRLGSFIVTTIAHRKKISEFTHEVYPDSIVTITDYDRYVKLELYFQKEN